MRPIHLKRTVMVFSALLASLLICFGQETPPDELAGTWTKSLNGRQMTFTISADHTYQVEFAGDEGIDVYGSCEISGNRVTFNDERGDYSADVPGVYTFQVSEHTVTFTEVNDPVMGRRSLLEGKWTEAGQ